MRNANKLIEYLTISDPCNPSPCLNDATCFIANDFGDGFFCSCQQFFTGTFCEQRRKYVVLGSGNKVILECLSVKIFLLILRLVRILASFKPVWLYHQLYKKKGILCIACTSCPTLYTVLGLVIKETFWTGLKKCSQIELFFKKVFKW